MRRATPKNVLAPPPGALGRGQKSFIFNYKVNFKDFYTKLCECTHKGKIQNILDGIFILSPGSCPRGGTWRCLGAKIKFRPAVSLLCYLLNHCTTFNQIWCVSYSHEWDVQLQSQFQRFLYQTLCVLSQIKDTKHIRLDFHSVAWVMPRGGTWCRGGQDDEQNRMKVKFSS